MLHSSHQDDLSAVFNAAQDRDDIFRHTSKENSGLQEAFHFPSSHMKLEVYAWK